MIGKRSQLLNTNYSCIRMTWDFEELWPQWSCWLTSWLGRRNNPAILPFRKRMIVYLVKFLSYVAIGNFFWLPSMWRRLLGELVEWLHWWLGFWNDKCLSVPWWIQMIQYYCILSAASLQKRKNRELLFKVLDCVAFSLTSSGEQSD